MLLDLRMKFHHAGVSCADDKNFRLRVNDLLNILHTQQMSLLSPPVPVNPVLKNYYVGREFRSLDNDSTEIVRLNRSPSLDHTFSTPRMSYPRNRKRPNKCKP